MHDPIRVAYERRNRDLDPQLVWRGKDDQDWSDLVVQRAATVHSGEGAPEGAHRRSARRSAARQAEDEAARKGDGLQTDLFADFNGVEGGDAAKTEFYQHEANWTNRMILGDSLQVMASLAEREGLRGKVQCIYFDPPYGIKFNSNFQWSTTSASSTEESVSRITREPEQVRAFRDTWRDGIHSYLTYLRDRLTVARDLLSESGSIFIQIGDENVHRVRALMDEVFGPDNFHAQVSFKSTSPLGQSGLATVYDYIIWYAKNLPSMKFRPLFKQRDISQDREWRFKDDASTDLGYQKLTEKDFSSLGSQEAIFRRYKLTSAGYTKTCTFSFDLLGRSIPASKYSWKTNPEGMRRLSAASRLFLLSGTPYFKTYFRESSTTKFDNAWTDQPAAAARMYVVQTAEKFVERCVLMTTDPGDLVLDPTCGSGSSASVSERWGRRWITIDTSRVALALARGRVMGARYPFYLLADSPEGQLKEAEVSRTEPSSQPTHGNIRHGFVYERVPHITLKNIANNAEIDVIYEKWQGRLEPLREQLNAALDESWEEWEIPRDPETKWPDATKAHHANWWEARIARQKEIDASIAANADFEYLYDKPYEDKKKVRVAGPFHRRKPESAPQPARWRQRRAHRPARSSGVRDRGGRRLRHDDSRKPRDGRRPASAQGGQDHVFVARALAR